VSHAKTELKIDRHCTYVCRARKGIGQILPQPIPRFLPAYTVGTLAEALITFLGEMISAAASTVIEADASTGVHHAQSLLAELRTDPRLHRPLALREQLVQAAGSNVRMGILPGYFT
jgi:hypothetical protein